MKQTAKNTMIVKLGKKEEIRMMISVDAGYSRSFSVPECVKFIKVEKEK